LDTTQTIDSETIKAIFEKYKDFSKLVFDLAKETRKKFLPVGLKQLKQITNELKTDTNKFTNLYLSYQLLTFWTDFEFIEYCLKFKEPKYSIPASRIMFERMIRINYVMKLPANQSEHLCGSEYLKTLKRYHKLIPDEELKAKEAFEAQFFKLSETIRLEDYKPDKGSKFPGMLQMLEFLYPEDSDGLYFFYAEFSEFMHGNVPVTFINNNSYFVLIFVILLNLGENIKSVNTYLKGNHIPKYLAVKLDWYKKRVELIKKPVVKDDLEKLFNK
jgi:hypothetical protein